MSKVDFIRKLFQSVPEYREFLRSGYNFRKSTPDGFCVATLTKFGHGTFQYHLAAGPVGSVYECIEVFRATEEHLALFHAGCSKVADRMEAYFATGDMEEFEHEDNFEELHAAPRGSIWVELVDDEELRDCLHTFHGHSHDKSYEEATKSLLAIPRKFDEHPEVMRLRILYHSEYPPGTFSLEQLAVWARKMVDMEPYDPLNWQVLAEIAERQDPKKAVEVFRESLRHHDREGMLLIGLTDTLCDLGRFDEARKSLRRILELDPCFRQYAWDSAWLSEIWDVLDEEPSSLPSSSQ
jgi:tetratricopeptide (TPR) repeat protein